MPNCVNAPNLHQERHDFGPYLIRLHTQSNDVDYESIARSESRPSKFGVEVWNAVGGSTRHFHDHLSNGSFNVSLSIPVHFRYFEASNVCEPHLYHVQPPTLYSRCAPVRERELDQQGGNRARRSVEWLYERTRLGAPGIVGYSYDESVGSSSCYEPVVFEDESKHGEVWSPVQLAIPTGCLRDADDVLCTTIVTLVVSTLLLLVLLVLKR